MHLQPKKQVTNELNRQKSEQINEGVKIAQKVDALRETLASLEAQHQKFLAGSREELMKATADLERNKSLLLNEVQKLEEKKVELVRPLDEEWEKLEENKAYFKKDLSDLLLFKDELKEREKEIKKSEKTIKTQGENLNERERYTRELNIEAQESKDHAERLRIERESELEKQRRDFRRETREFTKREEENNAWAKALGVHEEILNNREKKLNDKDKFINDKYQTLLRTINRIK